MHCTAPATVKVFTVQLTKGTVIHLIVGICILCAFCSIAIVQERKRHCIGSVQGSVQSSVHSVHSGAKLVYMNEKHGMAVNGECAGV